MSRFYFMLSVLAVITTVPVVGQDRLADPVSTAVLPLPDTLRSGATVIRYTDDEILRRGDNGITCSTRDSIPG